MSIPDILPPSPPTSSPLPDSSNSGSRKRVGFTLATQTALANSIAMTARDGHSSVKSILKQCRAPPLAAEVDPDGTADRTDGALESIVGSLLLQTVLSA